MKNKLALAIICIVTAIAGTSAAQAQTYIKANSLYWVVGVPNVSLETKLAKHFTYNTDLVFSPWDNICGRSLVIGQWINEFRYFPKQAYHGFYAAGYAAGHTFKLTKWNYNSDKYQKGSGISLGVTLGYELPIAKRWLIDFYVGGGWQLSWYEGFYRADNSRYVGWNASGEWIPYKIGVTFAFRL